MKDLVWFAIPSLGIYAMCWMVEVSPVPHSLLLWRHSWLVDWVVDLRQKSCRFKSHHLLGVFHKKGCGVIVVVAVIV